MIRKVCVITGSRADYGLMRFVLQEIIDKPELELQIIVTGMHLSETYGFTYKEIESDGFFVNEKVECLIPGDSPVHISNAIAKGIHGCAASLDNLKPDIVLILGDRFEILAGAIATLIARIPLAHIHGGEKTLGSYDDSIRHSITKMANIHFVATSEYRDRVIQLGENPANVHIVGGLGVDIINRIELLDKNQIQLFLGINLMNKILLVTFHPETLADMTPLQQMTELLLALSDLKDTTLIFTSPNADSGNLIIIKLIEDFVSENSNAHFFKSLGHVLYLSCMSIADGVLGNSSSGITETPSFRVGAINIGERQFGRIQANNVINCLADRNEVSKAIELLYSDIFQTQLSKCISPYGYGGASSKIVECLAGVQLKDINKKYFYDIK